MAAPALQALRAGGHSILGIGGFLLALLPLLPTPARAELGASLSLTNDKRFRGRSLSDGQPAATVDLSYDDASGLYLGGSATAVAAHRGVRILGVQGNAGYARKLGPGPTLDAGLVHARFTEYLSGGNAAHYSEAYIGLITNRISSHIHFSPHYFRRGVSTVYFNLDGLLLTSPKWRVDAHFGMLTQTAGARRLGSARTRYDWRIGVTRGVGALDLQLALTRSSERPFYGGGQRRSRNAVMAALTWIF